MAHWTMCLKNMCDDYCGSYLYLLTYHGGEGDLIVSNIKYAKHHVMELLDLPDLPITQQPTHQDFVHHYLLYLEHQNLPPGHLGESLKRKRKTRRKEFLSIRRHRRRRKRPSWTKKKWTKKPSVSTWRQKQMFKKSKQQNS